MCDLDPTFVKKGGDAAIVQLMQNLARISGSRRANAPKPMPDFEKFELPDLRLADLGEELFAGRSRVFLNRLPSWLCIKEHSASDVTTN